MYEKTEAFEIRYLNWDTMSIANKKLSCHREAAQCFMSLHISLSHFRSLEDIRNDTLEYNVCKSLY